MAAYGHPVFYSYIMKNLKKSLLTACMAFAALTPEMYAANRMDSFIDSLLNEMTLEEKIGQLNLPVSGILTGDARSENVAGKIRNGLTGGVFGVVGADECRKMQRIAVEEAVMAYLLFLVLMLSTALRQHSPYRWLRLPHGILILWNAVPKLPHAKPAHPVSAGHSAPWSM